ncbi:MAG: DUF4974 domain-containing protein [Tannerella sp.]|jgi:ferric-dicitrate binding protein FerR (iron transport regulator)|nr:DUF4974 domain-containing protein [Tannerella sp.]
MTEKEIRNQLQRIRALQEDIRQYRRVDVSRGYARTMRRIRSRQRHILTRSLFQKAAAVLFVPLLVSTLVLLHRANRGAAQATGYAEVNVLPGMFMRIELPDHSHVWLNSESVLRYPVAFGSDSRPVELDGEAFFDVRSDAGRPFEVTAPSGMKVVARGTAFNVKAYGADSLSEVVLAEGAVDVTYRHSRTTIRPGEMMQLNRQSGQLSGARVNVDEKTAWKDGRIIFRNTPIEEVMKQLARRYGVDITFQNPGNRPFRVRATFSTETVAQVLDYLKLAAPLEWRAEETRQNADDTFERPHIYVQIR